MEVKIGDKVTFTSNEKNKEKNVAFVPQQVIDAIEVNKEVLLDDGQCEFTIIDKDRESLTGEALVDCTVAHRKTMNTPGSILTMPSLTERDYQYLDGVDPKFIDYVGLSFVRDKVDVEILRAELQKRGIKADIIAKIENVPTIVMVVCS